jgi:hypothetical protein
MKVSLNVLFDVLLKVNVLMSPYVPFLTENMYQNMRLVMKKGRGEICLLPSSPTLRLRVSSHIGFFLFKNLMGVPDEKSQPIMGISRFANVIPCRSH